jgi:hypothetical protein
MCDYSLHSVRTRPAKVGEKLVTHNFGTGTRGFAAPEDCSVAVCVLPGTELAFEMPVRYQTTLVFHANTGPHRCDLSPDQQGHASHES